MLACVCGDHTGNETLPFFDMMTIGENWVEYNKGKGLARACQTSFDRDRTDPVAVFDTYCQLQWHFPRLSNDTLNFGEGADPNCGAFQAKVCELWQERPYSMTSIVRCVRMRLA